MSKKSIAAALLAAAFTCACADEKPAPETELIKYTNLSVDAGFDTVYQLTEFGTDRDGMEACFRDTEDMFRQFNDLFDIYNDYDGVNNLKTVNDNAGKQTKILD